MNDERKYWVECLYKIAVPVIELLAQDRLKRDFPAVDDRESGKTAAPTVYLEAACRTIYGIADYLETDAEDEDEKIRQEKLRKDARAAVHNLTEKTSKDYYCFWDGESYEPHQALVEASNIAFAILRAPVQLWEKLEERTKENLIRELRAVSHIRPVNNNWVLFSALVEAALYFMTGECDTMKVDYAFSDTDRHYKGDGFYGDGPSFAWDYYNSFVIHAAMVEVSSKLKHLFKFGGYGEQIYQKSLSRLKTFAAKLEQLIASDYTYAVFGRSSCAKLNSFNALAYLSSIDELGSIPYGRARNALTGVLKKFMSFKDLFDARGFMRVGLSGYQPDLAEGYFNRGSGYCFLTPFSVLRLRGSHPFWTERQEPTVWQKRWSDRDIKADVSRKFWLDTMLKIAAPVLENAAAGTLKKNMPHIKKIVNGSVSQVPDERGVSYLEAVGRTLCGVAPWLEVNLPDGEEKELQQKYRVIARNAIASVTDSRSPDFCVWRNPGSGFEPDQPLVDAAFFVQGLLRAKTALYDTLPEYVKANIVACLKQSAKIRPAQNNWLLFGAMVQLGLQVFDGVCDTADINYALLRHMERYLGDGVYGDGDNFAFDYYNSYVIHPMMLEIAEYAVKLIKWQDFGERVLEAERKRIARFAEVEERMIAPDGSYPPIGRSIVYRAAAFQSIALCALKDIKMENCSAGKIKNALSKVIDRCFVPDAFDKDGWLVPGLDGFQPELADSYITTGSLYLCSAVFLPLGISPDSEFWTASAEPTTWEDVWSGKNVSKDHARY